MANSCFLFLVCFAVLSCVYTLPSSKRQNVVKFDTNEEITKYRDCHHIHEAGYRESGTYTIWINGEYPLKVYCEMKFNTSATVIQRREYGDYSFQQTWAAYVTGFGHMPPSRGDFWIGLNSINYLTRTGNNVLSVVIQDWNKRISQASYRNFYVQDSTQRYRMTIGPKVSGDLADDLSFNSGMPFATQDNPDPNNCANHQSAGWWFNYCSYALPNGNYYFNGNYQPVAGYYNGIYWKDWMGYAYSANFISLSLSH